MRLFILALAIAGSVIGFTPANAGIGPDCDHIKQQCVPY